MAAADYIQRGKPLREQEIWADIRPSNLPEDGDVVAIKISPEDQEIFQYFLAVAASGQKDKRALAITEAVISINSASYHAWSYRWECLLSACSKRELMDERAFLERVAAVNVKNYQLWNHRRRLAFNLGPNSAEEELDFAAQCLTDDPKNYHAWAHRQAVVERFGLWQEELLFTAQMIQDDVRNNSAWNQRLFILSRAKLFSPEEVAQRELEFAAQAILKAPHNDSPWNYMRGLAGLQQQDTLFLARNSQLHSISHEVLEDLPSCSPALSLLADIYVAQVRECVRREDAHAAQTIASLAFQCFESLQTTDPIRKNYWRFRGEQVQSVVRASESK